MISSYLAPVQVCILCAVIAAVFAVSYSVYGHVNVIVVAGISTYVAAKLGFDWSHHGTSTITQTLLSVV
jgi:hypothetical protein